MFFIKLMIHFFFSFSIIVIFSNSQSPEWWKKNIDYLKEKLCNKDQRSGEEGSLENLAYMPEGIDAIRDVLPEICQHLNAIDLCSLRSVCRTFKKAADRELSIRSFEMHTVPISKSEAILPETLRDTLKIKPKLAVFLTNRIDQSGTVYDSRSRQLIDDYISEFPKDCSLLHLPGSYIFINTTKIEANTNTALAIFFHETKKIHISYKASKNINKNSLEKLFPEDWKNGTQLNSLAHIHFISIWPEQRNKEILIQQRLEELSRKFEKYAGKFSLWGGYIVNMASSSFGKYKTTINFAASIWGPGIQSWSLVINTSDDDSKVLKKLTDFKNSVNFTSEKTLVLSMKTIHPPTPFVNLSSLEENISKKSSLFAKTFTNLTTITYAIHMNEKKYCLDSWNIREVNRSPKLEYDYRYLCYLIINYL